MLSYYHFLQQYISLFALLLLFYARGSHSVVVRGVGVDVDIDVIDNNGFEFDLSSSSGRSTATPDPIQTRIPMSTTLRPQYIFSLHSNNTVFSFDILDEFAERQRLFKVPKYRLSVLVERIICYGQNNHLVLEGLGIQGEVTRSMKLCMIQDNEANGWQSVDNILDDVSSAQVKVEGDWASQGLSAQLVVSIYHEVDGGCVNCDPGEFCCGQSFTRARCIPGSGLCNRHPNCGLYSNPDEADATCSPRDCVGVDCHLAEVALRIAVLVVFCFLIPPTIIAITCRFQSTRRLRHRLNNVLDQCWGRGGGQRETTPQEETGGHHPTFCPRHGRDQVVTPPYNPDEDQPPSYEDFLQSQKTVSVIRLKEENSPPPSFDQAVAVEVVSGDGGNIGSGQSQGQRQGQSEGTVNPAFILNERDQ